MMCEFCNHDPSEETHHVARGIHRQASDEYEELKLHLCRECHDTIGEQKAQREMGLALLVRAGRGTVTAICELFYRVTGRRFPELWKVKKWVKRLSIKQE